MFKSAYEVHNPTFGSTLLQYFFPLQFLSRESNIKCLGSLNKEVANIFSFIWKTDKKSRFSYENSFITVLAFVRIHLLDLSRAFFIPDFLRISRRTLGKRSLKRHEVYLLSLTFPLLKESKG